jgi:hypothetical protein
MIIVIIQIHIIVLHPIAWLPRHFVLLLQTPSGVRKPRRHLRQRHFRNYRQHYLFTFGRIRVLFVFVQPRFERARRFPGGVFSSSPIQIHSVAARKRKKQKEPNYNFCFIRKLYTSALYCSATFREVRRVFGKTKKE